MTIKEMKKGSHRQKENLYFIYACVLCVYVCMCVCTYINIYKYLSKDFYLEHIKDTYNAIT